MNKNSVLCTRIAVFALALLLADSAGAQSNSPNFSGVDAKAFNPGRPASVGSPAFSAGFSNPAGFGYGGAWYGYGGNSGFGSTGFYSRLGGLTYSRTPLFSYGYNQSGFGFSLVPGQTYYYSAGPLASTVLMNNSFSISQWPFPNGSGDLSYGRSGWGYNGIIPNGWIADPFTGLILPIQPYSFPYVCSVPYFGGVSPYYPAAVIAPAVMSINLSMQPAPMTAPALALADPRILDLVAPAPHRDAAPNIRNAGAAQPAANANPAGVPDPGVPLLDEFPAVVPGNHPSTLADRIHSLRYQSTGDAAFRNADYASAAVFYKSAIDLAPDRRAPWLRMAFAQIATGDFPTAAASLKTGLTIPPDASRPWVTREELYGNDPEHQAEAQAAALWNWLSERPLSSDRLLLAGAFQGLRGFPNMAEEVLELASHEGFEADRVATLKTIIAADPGHRAAAADLAHILQPTTVPTKFQEATPDNISFEATHSPPAP